MLCAIAVELVPLLVNAQGPDNLAGIIIGFTLGVAVMLGMSVFLEGEDEEAESKEGTPTLDRSFDEEVGGRGGEMSRLLGQGAGQGGDGVDPDDSLVPKRGRAASASGSSVCSATSNTSSGARLRNHGVPLPSCSARPLGSLHRSRFHLSHTLTPDTSGTWQG